MNDKYADELDTFCKNVDLSPLGNKAIMVTGASGLIGSYLVDIMMRLNLSGQYRVELYALVRNKEKALQRFKEYLDFPAFNLIVQDVSNPITLDFRVDYIIHAASNANPRAFDTDPVGTIRANVTGTMHLLEYARECGAKNLLYVSSSEVYGEPLTQMVNNESTMGVIDPMIPRACYTESKRMAENICVSYARQYGVSSSIARVCFVYGPMFTDTDSRVIPQLLRNAIRGKPIVLKSTGALVRSYAYVYDVASGLMKILLEGKSCDVYNIANRNSNTSIREIAETISRVTDVPLLFSIPMMQGDKGCAPFSSSLLDASKLEATGWRPIFNLSEGLERTISILRYDMQVPS